MQVLELIRVALYGRTSGRLQEKSATINVQISVMEEWVKKQGYQIAGHYSDQNVRNWVPIHERPEGRRLLADAQRGLFDLVLVYDTSRWSRFAHISSPAIYHLKEHNVGFKSVEMDFDISTDGGELVHNLQSATEVYQYRKSNRRIREGKEYWLRATFPAPDDVRYHYWLEGKVPYGYKAIEQDRRLTLVPNHDPIPSLDWSEAAIVAKIYDLLVRARMSAYAIADWLNERGIPTHSRLPEAKGHVRGEYVTKGRWSPQTVSPLIRNTIYYGLHVYGKPDIARRRSVREGPEHPPKRQPVERHFPPIIDRSTWNLAQARLEENRSGNPRNRQHAYLLAGKLRCACCGCMYSGSRRYGRIRKPKEGVWFYLCEGKRNPKSRLADRPGFRCRNRPLHEWIEEFVWQKILDYVRNPDATLELMRQRMERAHDADARLQDELDAKKRLRNQMEIAETQALEDRADGILSREQFQRQMVMIADQKLTLDHQIEELEALLAGEVDPGSGDRSPDPPRRRVYGAAAGAARSGRRVVRRVQAPVRRGHPGGWRGPSPRGGADGAQVEAVF